jgi:glycine/serine hydroxymethyltransferase
MADAFVKGQYHFWRYRHHMMLIDLRNKGISGKAENALVKAEITVNKIWFHLMTSHHL